MTVDAFVARAKTWQGEIQKLRSILVESGLDEDINWGKPCFAFEGLEFTSEAQISPGPSQR